MTADAKSVSHQQHESQGAWDRIQAELEACLDKQTFRDFIRPCRPRDLRDGRLVLEVPTPHHVTVLTRRLADLQAAAERAGFPGIGLEFVAPQEQKTDRPRSARERLRERLVAGNLMSEAEFARLLRLARERGMSVRDLEATVESTLRAGRRVDSIFAVLSTHVAEKPASKSARPTPAAHTFARLLRVPALIASKRRSVTIRLRAPGATLELSRRSDIGMSPKLAAFWDFAFSHAARLSKDELEYDPKLHTYIFKIPSRDVARFLGREVLSTRDFEVLAKAMGATFSVGAFGRALKEERLETIVAFPLIYRTKGRNACVVFHMSAPVLEALRENHPDEVRAFPAEGLEVLRGLDSITAGLVRILGFEFHGRKHTDRPLVMTLDALHQAIVGTSLRSDEARWFFVYRLKQAVERIRRQDLLAAVGVPEPRWVVMEVQGDSVRFYRRGRLPGGKS